MQYCAKVMQANFNEFLILFLRIFVKTSRKVSDFDHKKFSVIMNTLLDNMKNRTDLSSVSSREELVKEDW